MTMNVLTPAKVALEAQAIINAAGVMIEALHLIEQVLDHNSDQAIDWGAEDGTPAYIAEDAVGNINGMAVTRQGISAAVGSLDGVRLLLRGLPLTWQLEGDHLGTLNGIVPPTTVRVSVRS